MDPREIRSCKTCNSDNILKLYSLEAKKYSPGTLFNLVRCMDCGLIFLDFEYDTDLINEYYPNDYKPHDPNRIKTSSFRKIWMQILRNFTFRKTCVFKSNCHKYLKQLISFLYNKTAYRSIPFYRGEGRLLDVGCGIGSYLSLMKDIGWEVRGVEAGENATLFARRSGLNVDYGSFEQVEYPGNYFDVITMWHVFEHFQDPINVLLKTRRILKDDGLFMIGVPNYASLDRRIFKEEWNGFEIPLHLNHFTPASINTLTKLTGFTCKKIIHTIRPSDMVSSLTNYFENKYKIANNRLIKKLLFLISIPISLFSSLLKRSSIIIVYIEKENH